MAADLGGTPYEGTQRPLCNVKLVELANGKSVVPMFHLFTDVPIPTRFFGLLVDDLNFTSNRQSILYGEKLGIQFAPVGIYDYTNRLVTTSESDYNGMYDVLLPSTNRISCPTPSGVCGNLYRFVGNDPGVPGRLNLNYNPQYRTISADFEAIPGQLIPADMAPTQVGVATEGIFGNITTIQPVACALDATTPQLYAVSKPYVNGSGSFTITGLGFGLGGQVTLDNTIVLPTTSWSDTQIDVTVLAGTAFGPHQLKITRTDNGQSTVNGLTYHVIGVTIGPFPSNGVLDNFNNRTAIGGNWATNNGGGFAVINNTGTANDYLRIRTADGSFSSARWTSGASFGIYQEAFFTFRQPLDCSHRGPSRAHAEVERQQHADQHQRAMDRGRARQQPGEYRRRVHEDRWLRHDHATRHVHVACRHSVPATSSARARWRTAPSSSTATACRSARPTWRITGTWTGDIGIRFEGTGNRYAGFRRRRGSTTSAAAT